MELSDSDEIESMQRDELVNLLIEIVEMVEEHNGRIENIMSVIDKNVQGRKQMEEQIEEMQRDISNLESECQRLRGRVSDSGGKKQKVASIVRFAANKRAGQSVVKVGAKEIKGATGCSRRYAYDLIENLPDEYDWALSSSDMSQYGSLELDRSDENRVLGIDFEGVHSAGVDVKKFTTALEGEGETS